MAEQITQLGRYKIEAHLGTGAFADVYRARDSVLKRTVALKVLKPALLADEETFARFLQEAQVTADLFHPHIATVLDLGQAENHYFIAMRFVDGVSLDKLLKDRGPLPWSDALKITEQIASALQFAHERELVHRDVKPQNILISQKEGAVLTDFGLVKAMQNSGFGTHTGVKVGTPQYMAPEIWKGESATPQTDQYALACVLIEMLTGKALFDAPSDPAIMLKHFQPIELPDRLPAETPNGLEAILRKALDQHTVRRFENINTFVASIKLLKNPTVNNPVTISPDNANRVHKLARWGKGSPEAVTWSPDGRLLAVGTSIGIALYDSIDLTEIYTIETEEKVSTVDFSSDGSILSSSSSESPIVNLWRVSDGNLLRTLIGHQGNVRSVAFSPDGTTLASAADDRTIRLWHVSNGKLLHTLEDKWSIFSTDSVAFSYDGTTLASVDWSNVHLWQVSDGKLLHERIGHKSKYSSIAFSPDGTTLASGSNDDTVCLWRMNDGELQHILKGHKGDVSSVAFSPDGTILASGSQDQTVRLWQVNEGYLLHTLEGHSGWVHSVEFSPDGSTLATVSSDHTLHLWRVSDGSQINIIEFNILSAPCMAISPSGKSLAVLSGDLSLHLIRISDKNLENNIENFSSPCIAFSPYGDLVAGSGMIHRVSNGEILHLLDDGQDVYWWCVAFSPDGQTLASGSEDKTVRLWQVSDGSLLRTLKGHTDSVRSAAFSPDGNVLASGSDDSMVRLWRVSDGKPLSILQGHTGGVKSIAFSPDGFTLASGSADSTVRLWQMSNGKLLRTIEGHADNVNSVAFSPNGAILVSGSNDKTIRLWNVGEGSLLRTLEGHADCVWNVVFSSDGFTLVSGSADGTVRLWGVQ